MNNQKNKADGASAPQQKHEQVTQAKSPYLDSRYDPWAKLFRYAEDPDLNDPSERQFLRLDLEGWI